MKIALWVIAALGSIVISLGAWAGSQVDKKAQRALDSTNVIRQRQAKEELEQAKILLQISAIAQSQGVPVIVDTSHADSVLKSQEPKGDTL